MIVLFKWLAHAIRATKLVYFRTIYVCLHINFYTHIHYPNQHDLLNWTLAYSTIEIGHWTLGLLSPNKKSVLIPITKIGISTLFIYQKHRHTGVCELFFCAFKDCYGLDMPRDSGKHNHAVRLFVETYRKFASVCGNISKTRVSNEETYLKIKAWNWKLFIKPF